MLSAERLKELLHYDQLTGQFIWKVSNNRTPAGSKAGSICRGYVRIKIYQNNYAAHRLAWFMVYGYLPKQIDHINGVKSDNRIANLREATHAQNMRNRASFAKSGFKGVANQTCSGRWQAACKYEGRLHHLGTYDTPEEAHKAYIRFSTPLYGEFANFISQGATNMSRQKSVVLTPAEKKDLLKQTKGELKAAKEAAKEVLTRVKAVTKERAAEDKARAAADKALQKEVDAAAKVVAQLEEKIASLTEAA